MRGPAGGGAAGAGSTPPIAPVAPLDILAQQIVAEVGAAEEWPEAELLALVRGPPRTPSSPRPDYEDVLDLVSEGITTGRGRRMAYLHRDQVNAVLPSPAWGPAGRPDQRGGHRRGGRLPGGRSSPTTPRWGR